MHILDLFRSKTHKKLETLKADIMHQRKVDTKEMKRLNKQVRLVTEHGHVEIIIRNVQGVIKELK
jgi:hypothetical protein